MVEHSCPPNGNWETERERWERQADKKGPGTQESFRKQTSSDLLPLAQSPLPKVSITPKIASPAEDQEFSIQYMSLWGTFHIQSITTAQPEHTQLLGILGLGEGGSTRNKCKVRPWCDVKRGHGFVDRYGGIVLPGEAL
jgi:hypothetical protein